MRILLDHCVDWRLKRSLPTHQVRTAQEMGWDALKNGKLLSSAAGQFDVLLTVDQNIKHQQSLAELPIAVVVMVAASNRAKALLKLLPAVEQVLSTLKARSLVEVNDSGQINVISPGQ
jgi:hypothetical protein